MPLLFYINNPFPKYLNAKYQLHKNFANTIFHTDRNETHTHTHTHTLTHTPPPCGHTLSWLATLSL